MPLQPASSDNRLPQAATRTIFQFKLTVNYSIDRFITFATLICRQEFVPGRLPGLGRIGRGGLQLGRLGAAAQALGAPR
jgi:hypothetical protein